MGLITQKVKIRLTNNMIKYYEDLGYRIDREKDNKGRTVVPRGTTMEINVNDLATFSSIRVEVKCDNCGKNFSIQWQSYIANVKEGGKYYCSQCVAKLYSAENVRLSLLKKGESFEQWCCSHLSSTEAKRLLNMWDYDLNSHDPNEVNSQTNRKYYFKCPRGLHESSLKGINKITQRGVSVKCGYCNSFAQWGIDNVCKGFLDKYWDYQKNTINPWDISKGSRTKVWIKCQNKEYHGSYDVACKDFVRNDRCPYCTNNAGKVHLLDSLGTLHPKVLKLWSSKNKKTPYNYSPKSQQKVWWKCSEEIHEDYLRRICVSNYYDFRCPKCNYSKGEEKISNYLGNNCYINISEEECDKLDNTFKLRGKYYIPQKKFNGLLGMANGVLSYDFHLPQYNLLIEYQGQQHERYIPGFHKSKKDFEKQQEHDRRKREYARSGGINLLEIWYWDYENIEEILDSYLYKSEVIQG